MAVLSYEQTLSRIRRTIFTSITRRGSARFLRWRLIPVQDSGSGHLFLNVEPSEDSRGARQGPPPIAVVFGWMEAWGVAGHALLLSGDGARFMDGFEDGVPRRPASRNDRQLPKECGNSTTPFGAVEVVAVQAIIAELCLDRLLEPGWPTRGGHVDIGSQSRTRRRAMDGGVRGDKARGIGVRSDGATMAITLEDSSVVAPFHRVTVQLSPDVLKVFDAHRQKGWFSREAGGQLFADIKGDVWHVVAATGPRSAHRRGRFTSGQTAKRSRGRLISISPMDLSMWGTGIRIRGRSRRHPATTSIVSTTYSGNRPYILRVIQDRQPHRSRSLPKVTRKHRLG